MVEKKINKKVQLGFHLLQDHSFKEVGQTGSSMGHDPRDRVVLEKGQKFRKDVTAVLLLEVRLHII